MISSKSNVQQLHYMASMLPCCVPNTRYAYMLPHRPAMHNNDHVIQSRVKRKGKERPWENFGLCMVLHGECLAVRMEIKNRNGMLAGARYPPMTRGETMSPCRTPSICRTRV